MTAQMIAQGTEPGGAEGTVSWMSWSSTDFMLPLYPRACGATRGSFVRERMPGLDLPGPVAVLVAEVGPPGAALTLRISRARL